VTCVGAFSANPNKHFWTWVFLFSFPLVRQLLLLEAVTPLNTIMFLRRLSVGRARFQRNGWNLFDTSGGSKKVSPKTIFASFESTLLFSNSTLFSWLLCDIPHACLGSVCKFSKEKIQTDEVKALKFAVNGCSFIGEWVQLRSCDNVMNWLRNILVHNKLNTKFAWNQVFHCIQDTLLWKWVT